MKKIITAVLALLLCMQTFYPLPVLADEGGAEEETVPESLLWATSESYRKVSFSDLLKDGKLIVPETMADVKIEEYSKGNGVMLSGPWEQLTSGKIGLAGTFNFDEKPVGRITIGGLSDKTFRGSVKVYLDGAEEPAATIPLRKRMGKIDWKREGEYTADVLTQNITGEHAVSISFDISGLKAGKTADILLRSIEFAENSLPVMYFDIDETEGTIEAMNNSEDHSIECYGTVTLQIPYGYKSEHTDKELTTMKNLKLEYVRGRGNSTWWMDKKPYKVKLDKKQDLLGMGENKHWVLLANRYDNSLLRNRMTYWMIGEHGLNIEFSPKCAPVEVVMNGNYYGSYLLAQQIRVGKTRVDIDELDETVKDPDSEEITGGYLVNLSGDEQDEMSNFEIASGGYYGIESPDFSDYPDDEDAKKAKEAQRDYIAGYIQNTENAICGEDFKDAAGRSYTEYLDEQSSINYWWIQEFSMNGDAYNGGSNYMYKKRNGKLYWGPLWDFDYVAWGDLQYYGYDTEGFDNTNHNWVQKLLTNPEYLQKTKDYWSQLSSVVQEVIKDGGLLDKYYDETRISQQYEVGRWGYFDEGGGYDDYDIAPIESSEEEEKKVRIYKDEIEQLRGWIQQRYDWVNENIDSLEGRTYTIKFKAGSKVVKTLKLIGGETIRKLPEAPKKKGYVFTGWYDRYGDPVTEDYEVYDSITVKAKYVKSSSIKKPKDIFFRYSEMYLWFEDDYIETYTPKYTLKPAGANMKSIKWNSSNTKVAVVDKYGKVTPKKAGSAVITATLPNGRKRSYKISYINMEGEIDNIASIKLNRSSLKLKAGKYAGLKVTANPKPHTTGYYTWISTDSLIASVDSCGVVTARWPGKATILVIEAECGKVRSCQVKVTASKKWMIRKARSSKTVVSAAAMGGRKIKVSWRKVPGAKKYEVRAASKKNGKYKKVALTAKASWTQKSLKKGKTMYYKVRPVFRIGKKTVRGKWSKAAGAKVE